MTEEAMQAKMIVLARVIALARTVSASPLPVERGWW